ncbi:sigma factor-like helix-turn-helix DNA-binding protein [Streptomyces sp. NPDC004959]|uniref:sigma factor-like helix-turn-helix DNA-binding protein n=1 Tax=unclassified Streptomyces TaxID=2593676 RepID=UPI0004CC27F2|nr:sigma factor-like helix-turn-helix DNA-binding protein [Streptomyces sp. NRRL F-5630]
MASAGRAAARRRRPDDAREFAAYVGGAAPRLLRTAALLTGEAGQPPGPEPSGTGPTRAAPAAPLALALLRRALARTCAVWDRLEDGDPYDHTRAALVALVLRSSWYRRRRGRGPLAALPARVRLVLVLRLHEGVAEEQVAALLGLSVGRVRLLCARGTHLVARPPVSGAEP